MKYEYIEDLICSHDVRIHNWTFQDRSRIKGIYYSNNIAVASTLSWREKGCILAEELGHHLLTHGDITDQSIVSNRKQEHRARSFAYETLISIKDIQLAIDKGMDNEYELADYLEVTVEFLRDAMAYYQTKYGIGFLNNK